VIADDATSARVQKVNDRRIEEAVIPMHSVPSSHTPRTHPSSHDTISPPPRICCMISGGGRPALNLVDAIERGELQAIPALVISSDAKAPGVARCQARGLEVVVIPGRIARETLESKLREFRIDWVVLAGYLKFVDIPESYQGRVVNIHPALLPKFGGSGMHGQHVHTAVLAARERRSGCTVHLCDDRYDTGPIVLQMSCPVETSDTPDSLATRVFELECKAYPLALVALFTGASHA
jgi:phosphoribosylglycinamide formyltransferase 1